MTAPVQAKRTYRFGLFDADPSSGELLRKGSRVKLQDQPFRLLIILLERAGAVVSREALRQQLWPSDTYVEFDGSLKNTLKKLRSALGDSADNPTFIETLPKRGYRFIAPVTIQDPAIIAYEQPQGKQAHQASADFSFSNSVFTRRVRTGRGLATSAVIFVVLVSGAVASYHRIVSAKERAKSLAPQMKPRMSVAVLEFSNASERAGDAWLATGLSEMLTTELAAGEQLRMVSSEEVTELKSDAAGGKPGTLSKDTLTRIRQNLGADVVVLGSYSSLGKQSGSRIRLDVRLQDAADGETIAAISETGTESGLFQLVSRAGERLRSRLAVPAMSDDQVAGVQASLPSNTEAARWYAEGLAKLRLFDALAARDLLERAIQADSAYALAHSALAEAWALLGYEEEAKSEAKKAFELAGKLPRKDRMFIEARYRVMNREWEKALEIYRTLFDFFPDDIELGLRLVDAQTEAGKKNDAVATIQRLRKLPPPERDDLRIDLTEEKNYTRMGEYKAASEVAGRAVAKARASDLSLLLAQALCREASVLAFLGEGDKAIAAAEEARNIYSTAGDQFGASAALVAIGKVLWLRGDYEGSERVFQQAVATDRTIGNKSGYALDLRFLAGGRGLAGDLRGAGKLYQEALDTYRETGDREHVAYSLNDIAWVLKSDGNPAGTLKVYDEALSIFREMQNGEGAATTLDEKCNSLVMLGELDEARDACQQALVFFRESGEKNKITRTLNDLANIASLQDKLEDSRSAFSEALAIDRKAGDAGAAVSVELGLAEVTEEEGDHAKARQQIAEALDYLRQHKDANDEVNAQCLLAEIALTEGNITEARRAIDAAKGLLRKDEGWNERFIFEITNARIQAASGKPNQARKSLHAQLAEATRHNYIHYALEARLALCEVEARTDPASARLHERVLEKEARQKGFGMIARKAQALEIESGKKG
jgi:DNA-binding winged helix-turn-helix (wHTH) protein/tetratricopeptide (TPR) repeat protein